jgi:diguanylate cyclase (GGDEF)-like protein
VKRYSEKKTGIRGDAATKSAAPRIIRSRSFFAVLTVFAVSLSGPVAAADSYPPMRFDHVSLDEGLSQSNVFTILQDSQGLMWFGTENGLNSYNGYEFTHYRQERGNPAALGSDFIYEIVEDADGNLWIATNGGGLARMDAKDRSIVSYRHQPGDKSTISSNVIRALLLNADGSLWLGTRGGGLDLLDPATGKVTHHAFAEAGDDSGSPNEIFELHAGNDGRLWIGSNRGLARLDRQSGEVITYRHDASNPTSLSDDRVRAIFEDSAGRLWVGTYGGGLNRLDPAKQSFVRYQHDAGNSRSIASNRVTSIFEDAANRLWVGTSGGLNIVDYKTGSFSRFQHDNTDRSSLSDDDITALYQDRGGMLWVGTRYRGLSKWNPDTWAFGLDTAKTIVAGAERQPNVTSFVTDDRGMLWVGTFGDGLNVMRGNNGEVTRYRNDPDVAGGLSDNRVMSLLRDSYGDIWIGTMTGGVNRLNPASGKIDVFRHIADDPTSLSADGIMALYEDSLGRIWVGTFGGGISRYDRRSGEFQRYQADKTNDGALSSNRVTSFAEDTSGRMWVGTDAGGLNLYDPKTDRFHTFRHDPEDPQSLAADTVYAINIDKTGTVWVGTRGGGLDRVHGSASAPAKILFENFSQSDGLANDVIYGIQFDNNGHLWLSTNYGISRLNPETRSVRNLHRKDGLQSEEFNFGAHYRSANGELFFGGHNGFNSFQPDALPIRSEAPPLMLTGVYNGNEPLRAEPPSGTDDGIELNHNDDSVSFEFAALDYASPAHNSYRYKLEGFDRDWIDLGNRRRITYTDLNDGKYILRVQAANSAGVWNEAGLALPVRVKPAPWDTWWAYLGYAAMVLQLGLALWLGHRRRIRREEEYSQQLEFEVRHRTQSLLDRNKQLNDMNRSLQQSNLSDPLTGLRNRRFVFEEVSRDLAVARRRQSNERLGMDSRGIADLVFMMIDLDNFKPINDTFGHAAGDKMLLQVRDVLLSACRPSDFVVRWGGDEFVIIAKQAMPGESEALAERIRSRIAAQNFLLDEGQLVRTTCSIGFAQYPLFRNKDDDADLDRILGLADDLMYEAKKRRNAWAGLLSPNEAATSFDYDHDSVDPKSLLFRARRADTQDRPSQDDSESPRLAVVR